MDTLLTVLHVIAAVFLVLVVLLQQGKGASMGAAFGAGSSQTMFGTSGAGNLLTRLTTAAAVVFMITSLTLATLSQSGDNTDSVINEVEQSTPAPSEKTDSE